MNRALRALADSAAMLPQSVKLLARLARDPRVPPRAKRIAAILAVYAVVPVDLAPDWIPLVGLVDDLLALLVGVTVLLEAAPEEVVAEHWDGSPENLDRLRSAAAMVMDFLPKRMRWLLRMAGGRVSVSG